MLKVRRNLIRILSIDGGGIRGIIPGQIMVLIEDKLKKNSGNPDASIADYFDLIAGTSTGGILACAYLCPDPNNRPMYSASEVVDLYLRRGQKIFSTTLKERIRSAGGLLDEKYPSDELEAALDEYFGTIKLSQLLKPCLISSYDIKRRQAHFFNQMDAARKKGWDFYVKDIARATSAAPTYFECVEIRSMTNIRYPLIDGGVFVNNPALCAYAEVHNKFGVAAREMAILSLGTGYEDKSYDYKQVKDWGLPGWSKPLLNIMMSGSSEVVDYQLRQIYSAVKAPNQYLRINTEFPIDVNSQMDDASQANMEVLKELGTETAQKFENQIDDFINLLVANSA